ncbi:cytochrome P450 3A40-like [Trichomycterus rosablanca]|uniref:cytochrome P450 3A40-like n=1 Tax=Trichomycterus rosablanca TaxID=2290929 RepID=UPI002F359C85
MEGYLVYFSAETWTLLLLLISLVVVYGYWPYGLFRQLGIPGPKPLPFVGTLLEYKKAIHEFDMECFQKYGKTWGIYDGRSPVLCTVDSTIIKSVLVKEFYTYFTNKKEQSLGGPLKGTLFDSKDEEWKRIRSALSPLFTSGRLKEMFWIMKNHSNTLVKNLEKTAKQGGGVNINKLFGAYTMDVITGSAFSVNIDSLNNPNDPFASNVKKMMDFNLFSPGLFIAALFPFLLPVMEKLNFSVFSESALEFFFAALKRIKVDRLDENYKRRVDFLQLMIESQTSPKNEDQNGDQIKKGLSDNEILCQSVIFMLAGYESGSSSLSFFFYNMATNPDAMRKLQEEIDHTFPNQAQVEYDPLMNMDYLEATLSESLRLFPAANRLDRFCKKTVEINGITIPKQASVVVPIYALHRDPEYWPDPDVFNPERFTKGNKENVDPYMYMPFGAGPRICIGMRFALVSLKLAIVEILQRFDVSTCDETKIPLEFCSKLFMCPKEPIKLKFTPRGVGASKNDQH